MREITLKPEGIFKHFKLKDFSKKEAADKLLFLIENDESSYIRSESLIIIDKIGLKGERFFNIIENLLISDDDPVVRATALDLLFQKFPKKCESLLLWLFQNKTSPSVLFSLFKLLKNTSNEKLISHKKKILERYAVTYGVVFEEAKFFLEWEYLYFKEEPYIEIGYFLELGTNSKYRFKNDSQDYSLYVVEDKHVTALNLSNQNLGESPVSVKFLSKLTWLSLAEIKEFPDFLENLPRLRELYLAGIFSKRMPDWLISIVKKKYIFKYIVEGVNYEDSIVLGLLKILGWGDLIKVPIEYDAKSSQFSQDYKIDVKGNVIGIYTNSEKGIGGIPVEIGNLKYIKELKINSFGVNFIPESIGKLTSLEYLEISFGGVRKIPVSICNLKALKHLDLSSHKIEKIPKYINLLTSLEVLNLAFNQIDEIPNSLSQIDSLRELFINNNNLRMIPGSIQELSNLQVLYLYENQIYELPKSIKRFVESLDEFILKNL